ncbi:MAG TPA: MFS transporter [Polyangiaceae bacterium]|nr:MFS transporter [Polyangiaceae bacterium]
MTLKRRLLLTVFTTSFSGTLLQRGAYFYTHQVLGFSQAQNLWLALLIGITYVVGASASHPLSARFGERRTLLSVLLSLISIHVLIASVPSAPLLVVALASIGLLQGAMWPIFESYMSAGETPRNLGRILSRYNMTWALSVPLSLALAGVIIASGSPRLLFVAAAALFSLVANSCRAFPAQPAHLEADHVERPDAAALNSYRPLLTASRLAMLLSYALMYVLAPLMPEIMKGVGLDTASAARAASLLDVARLACFIGLFAWSGWHSRKLPIFLAIAALPVGFALVLLSSTLVPVVIGEVLFGAAAGLLYTAALYYAQVVQNASVDAGGAHEALIGLGYALGPGAGLIGTALAHGAGPGSAGYAEGMSTATLPLVAICSCAALWQLLRRRPEPPPPRESRHVGDGDDSAAI